MKFASFDVIIIKGNPWSPISWPIMWRGMSNDTHCLVYRWGGTVYDPTIGGVHITPVENYAEESVKILRYRDDINYDKLSIWTEEKQRLSEGYDYLAWMGFATGWKALVSENRWFCSEFPYWMFEDNGYKIFNEKLIFPLPGDLARCPRFEVIFRGKLSNFLVEVENV